MTEPAHGFRVGCDVGGTFTDFVLLDEASGEIVIDKRLTTPADPSVGTLDGLKALESARPGYVAKTRRVAHATTLISNSVIERKGARTALLTTEGFRDVLEMRRHVRVTTYELWADPPEPLIPRYLRLPVAERTYSDGSVLKPVDPDQIAALVATLREHDVESVAVALLHAYVNPENERRVAELIGELAPEIAVTTSSSVLPQIKEYERSSTAVVNAYVKPLTRRYLNTLDDGLQTAGFKAPLRIMLSNGGIASAETAGTFPIRLVESGPVAGAIVSRQYAELLELDEVLSFDMGGTTAKACLIRNRELPITDELEVARSRRFTKSSGFPVAVPAVDMIEVGAGGGSIAGINALGLVQVGPESAGAEPGPVCYAGGGTEPTVTDVDLVLGYLNPDYFAGGAMPLDDAAAERAITARLAGPLARDTLAAAWTVHDVVNETMASAVRMHVTERGGSPQRATLVAFGGAGPVHAYNLAAKLGIPQILVPLRPGVLSALGLLVAPAAFDLVRTHKMALEAYDPAAIDAAFEAMTADVTETLREVDADATLSFTRAADIGYIGQGYQVAVPLDATGPAPGRDALWRRFASVYREKYGYFYDDVPAELVNLRVGGRLIGGELTLQPLTAADELAKPSGERLAFSGRRQEMLAFAVYDRAALRPGASFAGPAIVEEATATTVIDVDGRLEVDGFGSLVISVGTGEES